MVILPQLSKASFRISPKIVKKLAVLGKNYQESPVVRENLVLTDFTRFLTSRNPCFRNESADFGSYRTISQSGGFRLVPVSAGEKGGHFHRNKWVPVLERA